MWALIPSALLHLLLVLFSVWFPFRTSTTAAAAEPFDETLTFSFAQNVDPTTDDPLEDSPFDPREPQPLPEQPVPLPEPEAPEVDPAEQVETEAAALELPDSVETPPVDDPIPEPAPEPEIEPLPEAPETAVESPDQVGAEIPESPDGTLPQAPSDTPPPTPKRQFDMNKALRDFGEAMAARPPTVQPAPAEPAPQNVILPDLSSIPPSGFGMGNLVFESRDYDWNDYGRQVYMAIWRAWHNRLWMTTDEFEKWAHRNQNWRLGHSTQIRFVIEDNGQVTGIMMEAGSSCQPLDASALEALAEVILPPLPPDFPRDREVVHARFVADGPIRAMRPVLGRYKSMGMF
jgi:hypothetical protein